MNKTLENGKISNVNGPENLILQKYLFHQKLYTDSVKSQSKLYFYSLQKYFLNLKIYRKALKTLNSQMNYEQKEYGKNYHNI